MAHTIPKNVKDLFQMIHDGENELFLTKTMLYDFFGNNKGNNVEIIYKIYYNIVKNLLITIEEFNKCFLSNRLDEMIHIKYTNPKIKDNPDYEKFSKQNIKIGKTVLTNINCEKEDYPCLCGWITGKKNKLKMKDTSYECLCIYRCSDKNFLNFEIQNDIQIDNVIPEKKCSFSVDGEDIYHEENEEGKLSFLIYKQKTCKFIYNQDGIFEKILTSGNITEEDECMFIPLRYYYKNSILETRINIIEQEEINNKENYTKLDTKMFLKKKIDGYIEQDKNRFKEKFELTNNYVDIDDIIEMLEYDNRCYICRDKLQLCGHKKYCKHQFTLDRIDNSKPHMNDNVLPCCYFCNCFSDDIEFIYNENEILESIISSKKICKYCPEHTEDIRKNKRTRFDVHLTEEIEKRLEIIKERLRLKEHKNLHEKPKVNMSLKLKLYS